MDGRPIIAPAYRRFLFRYTSLLFFVHSFLTLMAVIFREKFILFPFLFMPRLGVIEAFMYLPTAFLTDLGIVALILYFITQSGKDIKLPWPTFAVDIDELRAGKHRIWTIVNLLPIVALTGFAIYLYIRHNAIFFTSLNFANARPLLMPEVGRQISLIVIAMLAVNSLLLLFKLFTSSRWVDAASDILFLALIGLLLRQPFNNPFAISVPAVFLPKIIFGFKFALLFAAAWFTIDLTKSLIIIGRRRLAK
jgi:hypothetical protein